MNSIPKYDRKTDDLLRAKTTETYVGDALLGAWILNVADAETVQ